MAIMPGASRVQKFSGNTHKRAVTKIVLHTTEGGSWPGYGGGGSAPHFTVHRDGTIRQHIDTSRSAKALVNRSGGVETNNGGVIQIEFIGSCDRAWARKHGLFFTEDATDKDLAGLARVLAWISKTHGVPLTATGLRWPTSNAAYATAPQRMSYSAWNAYRGVCGHTHVPENDHWDPGAFPIARLLKLAGGSSSAAPADPADTARPWRTSPRVKGYSVAEVKAIQRELVAEGYSVGSYGVDGSYGDGTGAAVKALQADLGLTQDGIYGPSTEDEMASIKAIVTENQRRIGEVREIAAENQRRIDAARKEIDWVRRVSEANQKRIDKVDGRVGPIKRGGKDVSIRQELADAKTLAIANAGGIANIEEILAAADVDASAPAAQTSIEG